MAARDETPRTDLLREHVVEWNRWEPVSDTQLRVWCWQGNRTAYGVRAVVAEDEQVVRLATVTGTRPDAPGMTTMEALEVSLLVDLAAPLGDREVRQHPDALG
ncbi:hypothetical protein [uncultured Nocardioides sp.]|uniref:hypothetical protein n=1 Tax=uncultured Nocardioides sp. TaxID=198441 RepID=UPI00261E789C|nr:hypothetical protein [uncultured Nocardioides sp.]